MAYDVLIYGSYGFVGDAIARLAVQRGLHPLLAGRNADALRAQAAQLDVEHRVVHLEDTPAMESALREAPVVLHCAGPYVHTSNPMVRACLSTGTHYLDITGEIPVFERLAAFDDGAKAKGVMILPGVGFDVVATDCLALHLKERLPSTTRLTLGFHVQGPARMPPGTANTLMEMIPYGTKVRRDGELRPAPRRGRTRLIDFGNGPITATRLTWGDIFTAYHTTGIPNIEDFIVLPDEVARQMRLVDYVRPAFRLAWVRRVVRSRMPTGSTPEERALSHASVWGEVEDGDGHRAVSRLHGPEAGVVWTAAAALDAVEEVLAGRATAGFQTPARAYGADFVLKAEGVRREDVEGVGTSL